MTSVGKYPYQFFLKEHTGQLIGDGPYRHKVMAAFNIGMQTITAGGGFEKLNFNVDLGASHVNWDSINNEFEVNIRGIWVIQLFVKFFDVGFMPNQRLAIAVYRNGTIFHVANQDTGPGNYDVRINLTVRQLFEVGDKISFYALNDSLNDVSIGSSTSDLYAEAVTTSVINFEQSLVSDVDYQVIRQGIHLTHNTNLMYIDSMHLEVEQHAGSEQYFFDIYLAYHQDSDDINTTFKGFTKLCTVYHDGSIETAFRTSSRRLPSQHSWPENDYVVHTMQLEVLFNKFTEYDSSSLYVIAKAYDLDGSPRVGSNALIKCPQIRFTLTNLCGMEVGNILLSTEFLD
jgi:hypothetical protein